MTALIEVPQTLDDRSFEQVASGLAAAGEGRRVLVDAHATEWASPFGLVALLCAGQTVLERRGTRALLTVPADRDVAAYWVRAGFFGPAQDLFEIHGTVPRIRPGPESTVLLEVTPVRVAGDVHRVVAHIQDRAAVILSAELGLEAKATMGFGMALSEACQNIVEHAGTGGWVAVHAYSWRKRLGKRVVVIAVADAGVGFRHTLDATQAAGYGDRWGDATALEAALMHGVSRYREPGRGLGLREIRKYMARWDGKISIRSGTARISTKVSWDDDTLLKDGLAPFAGSQLQLVIPAGTREAE